MEFRTGPPSRWLITLVTGSVLEVWADAFSETGTEHVFMNWVSASREEQEQAVVLAQDHTDPTLVEVVAARIPSAEISVVEGGPHHSA